ncbi:Serine/threonine kinase [Minicystis rosea]|nr:Serine/threonine kinase [Minicystis rosea]
MATEHPRKAEDDAPLFRGDSGDGGGGRGKVLTIGAIVTLIGVFVVIHATRSEAPPKVEPTASLRQAPKPLDVPEGTSVRVPGGSFAMGSEEGDPDEKPVSSITVAPFELDTTEVTVAAYAKCVAAGKCTPPDTGMYCNWKKAGREAHPINCLDWAQANAYCTFAGKRLPTEPEWELAARGPEGRKYPWKEGPIAAQVCWNGEGNDQGRGQRQGTCPVASYPAGASPVGALDMLGNVWEWTASPYCPYPSHECQSDKRVIRGGAWNNLDPAYVRAADRAKEPVGARPDNVGVRCAKNPS